MAVTVTVSAVLAYRLLSALRAGLPRGYGLVRTCLAAHLTQPATVRACVLSRMVLVRLGVRVVMGTAARRVAALPGNPNGEPGRGAGVDWVEQLRILLLAAADRDYGFA